MDRCLFQDRHWRQTQLLRELVTGGSPRRCLFEFKYSLDCPTDSMAPSWTPWVVSNRKVLWRRACRFQWLAGGRWECFWPSTGWAFVRGSWWCRRLDKGLLRWVHRVSTGQLSCAWLSLCPGWSRHCRCGASRFLSRYGFTSKWLLSCLNVGFTWRQLRCRPGRRGEIAQWCFQFVFLYFLS